MDLILGVIIACIAVLLYIVIKQRLNYFTERGFDYAPTSIIDQIQKLSIDFSFNSANKVYEQYKDSGKDFIGYFNSFLKPVFVILDTKLIESVMIKDFSHFHDHGFDVDTKVNPLFGHLFMMKGDEWRTLRNKLLPTFTSGKLKGMIPTMEHCADNFIEKMKQDSILGQDVDMKFFQDYTLAVITICAFGMDPKSLQNPDCEFKKVMNNILSPTIKGKIKMGLIVLAPKIAKLLKIKMASEESEKFFFNLTREAFEMRKKSGVKRNDFIQLLLELKEKGSVEVDTKDLEEDERETIKEMQNHTLTKLELTHELLTAQVFVFLVAGFENSAYIVQITSYLLSKNPDIQKKVREEIKEIKSKHGKIDYLALRDMKLLSACVDGEIIEKGKQLLIPVQALHHDSKFWTEPEKFNPNRFINDEVQPCTYLPFGDGPRICIAQRLALVMSKMIMAKLIEAYEIHPSSKTKEPIKLNPIRPSEIYGGLWARFVEVN